MKESKYVEVDELLYPDLKNLTQKGIYLSRFGRMKKTYMQEHQSVQFTNLLVNGELDKYLQMFDEEVNDIYERLIEQYKIKRNITEELKERNQILWIQEMNNIESTVMEFIRRNYIYN